MEPCPQSWTLDTRSCTKPLPVRHTCSQICKWCAPSREKQTIGMRKTDAHVKQGCSWSAPEIQGIDLFKIAGRSIVFVSIYSFCKGVFSLAEREYLRRELFWTRDVLSVKSVWTITGGQEWLNVLTRTTLKRSKRMREERIPEIQLHSQILQQ